jgi:TonB family protein
MRVSSLSGAALVVAASLATFTGCKKPEPVLVSPKEVEVAPLDQGRLSQTQAAEQGKGGSVKVKYCIDPEGQTQDVEVVESFGDAEVDALVVETVDAWRYEPATRDGIPYETCSDYTFRLDLGQ